MYVIEKLKLNKFKLVAIPKAKDLYARLGTSGLAPNNAYSGDESLPLFERKTDTISRSIADYEEYAREQAGHEEYAREQAGHE